jgi:hypothetical protein
MDKEGSSFLILKDFTTVLTMHREARMEILAQLREIYDGGFVKEFGTGETVAWEGRLGFLAGVTPVVDNHRIVSALLGERFVYVRLPQQDRARLSRQGLKTRDKGREMREELQEVTHRFLEGIGTIAPDISETTTDRLMHWRISPRGFDQVSSAMPTAVGRSSPSPNPKRLHGS